MCQFYLWDNWWYVDFLNNIKWKNYHVNDIDLKLPDMHAAHCFH